MRQSWSYDPIPPKIVLFTPYCELTTNLISVDRVVSEKCMFGNLTTGGRRMPGFSVSSPMSLKPQISQNPNNPKKWKPNSAKAHVAVTGQNVNWKLIKATRCYYWLIQCPYSHLLKQSGQVAKTHRSLFRISEKYLFQRMTRRCKTILIWGKSGMLQNEQNVYYSVTEKHLKWNNL